MPTVPRDPREHTDRQDHESQRQSESGRQEWQRGRQQVSASGTDASRVLVTLSIVSLKLLPFSGITPCCLFSLELVLRRRRHHTHPLFASRLEPVSMSEREVGLL